MKTQAVAPIKITLAFVETPVMRRIVVPLTIRLNRLHLAIQAAMGWTNSHPWEIWAHDAVWGAPDRHAEAFEGPLDARKFKLRDLLAEMENKTLKYVYDAGIGWELTLKVERIRDAAIGPQYPILLDAKGASPPENVGGAPGYADFLGSPHERGDFDPAFVDRFVIEWALEALAKKWAPRSKAPTPIAKT